MAPLLARQLLRVYLVTCEEKQEAETQVGKERDRRIRLRYGKYMGADQHARDEKKDGLGKHSIGNESREDRGEERDHDYAEQRYKVCFQERRSHAIRGHDRR